MSLITPASWHFSFTIRKAKFNHHHHHNFTYSESYESYLVIPSTSLHKQIYCVGTRTNGIGVQILFNSMRYKQNKSEACTVFVYYQEVRNLLLKEEDFFLQVCNVSSIIKIVRQF